MTSKEDLIKKIHEVFQGVKLEEGVGLWEGQGHDDQLTAEECRKLRERDEKEDWMKIPIIDLYKCSSSLSFFDAKGMRFHMPIFLLFALDVFEKEEENLYEKGLIQPHLAPDVEFHLLSILRYINREDEMDKRMRSYHNERFSLFNTSQIQCFIDFLQLRKKEIEEHYDTYVESLGASPLTIRNNKGYIAFEKGIAYWNKRMKG